MNSPGVDRIIEALWKVNQSKLALSLLEALDGAQVLEQKYWMLLTLLGLRLQGVAESTLATKVLIENKVCQDLLHLAGEMGLYDISTESVTLLGKEFLSRFRKRYERKKTVELVALNPSTYYPQQCEGKFRKPGKTVRNTPRMVPMES